MELNKKCPCGNGDYHECCEPFHKGISDPKTAEQLMRSRYSAFVYHKGDYLLNTWDESTRPSDIELAFSMKWTQLKIIRCKLGRAKDSEGWVTFKADYQQGEQAGCLHEKSYFRRDEHNRWRYVDGRIFSD